jgi:hypothetical protein
LGSLDGIPGSETAMLLLLLLLLLLFTFES